MFCALSILYFALSLGFVETRRKLPCEARANATIMECQDNYRKRMRKDLRDREQCCALARLRHCISDAIEDQCTDSDEADETYIKWRKEDDLTHPEMTIRCIDDSHDKLECIFLNFMTEVIVSLVLALLITSIIIIFCIWLIFFRSTRRSHLDL